MKLFVAAVVSVCLLACAGFAQQPAAAPPSTTPSSAAPAPDRAPIEATLKAYVTAYNRRSLDEVVAVWPDLPNEKKDYKKLKDHLQDTHVSSLQFTLQPLETQSLKDDAVVKCERNEQFVKAVTITQQSGDAMMSDPFQRPGNTQRDQKKNVNKKDTVWVKLHKNGDTWQIVSILDKPLTP